MSQVIRREQILQENINAEEVGTVAAVTATGRYKTFDTAFGAAPTVMVTPTGIGTPVASVLSRDAGSFNIALGSAGTAEYQYFAWGSR